MYNLCGYIYITFVDIYIHKSYFVLRNRSKIRSDFTGKLRRAPIKQLSNPSEVVVCDDWQQQNVYCVATVNIDCRHRCISYVGLLS